MSYKGHSELKGTHAFLCASQPSWLNYDKDKLIERYSTVRAAELGTALHEQAARDIKLGLFRPDDGRTFNMYVNDAIGFRMSPEELLYFSDNFYGTADAISFRNGLLKIHDLKTGISKVHPEQLKIYAALYCLEHGINPKEIEFDLNFYQNDEIQHVDTDVAEIKSIIKKGKEFSKIIDEIKGERGEL